MMSTRPLQGVGQGPTTLIPLKKTAIAGGFSVTRFSSVAIAALADHVPAENNHQEDYP